MKLIDVSRTLYTGAPHWPGDSETDYHLTARMADGSSCNVGRLSLSIHAGSHVDAPRHYNDRGASIEALAPEIYVGPARVIDARGQRVFTEQLFAGLSANDLAATPRILFRTDTWKDPATFPLEWPVLDRTLPAWLAAHGVKLIGLDVPSVDELNNKDMAIHHLLEAANILILESLDLSAVEPGVYELIALPLKIRGADGSPVRAVLRSPHT
jgi:arylformamidase